MQRPMSREACGREGGGVARGGAVGESGPAALLSDLIDRGRRLREQMLQVESEASGATEGAEGQGPDETGTGSTVAGSTVIASPSGGVPIGPPSPPPSLAFEEEHRGMPSLHAAYAGPGVGDEVDLDVDLGAKEALAIAQRVMPLADLVEGISQSLVHVYAVSVSITDLLLVG